MVEAEDAVHSDHVGDGEVRQHDVQAHVAKLLVVARQVGVEAGVKVTQVLHRLQHHLENDRSIQQIKCSMAQKIVSTLHYLYAM